MVKNFVSVKQGFSVMENFCMVTNVEGLSSNAFCKHASSMAKLAVQAGESNLEKARERVGQVYRQLASESEPTPPQMSSPFILLCLLIELGIKGAIHQTMG